MKLTLWRLALILVCATTSGSAVPQTWTADRTAGLKDLEDMWTVVSDPSRTMGVRGLFRFAVEATGLGWHPERVEVGVGTGARDARSRSGEQDARKFQVEQWPQRRRGSQRRGICIAAHGLHAARQSAQLSAEGPALLDAMMTDAIDGLRSHVVKIDYTNIFVMKAWGLIAIGEALGRADVAADGYRRFDAWMEFTARHGIGEYGAVVYYGIDLDSLALIARFAGRAEARAKAERAIRYVWTDLAANWWAPGDRMGGTNARTYDYIYGHGYTEAHTWTAGWLRERPELEGAGWVTGVALQSDSTFREAVMWPPPAEWTEPIRAQVPRTVVQRWGEQPEQRAVNWIGRHVSLASSGMARSRDERTLVANLGDSPAVPQLTLFMEGRRDPYGYKKQVGGKALHLMPFIATVQRGPEVLQVLSDNPLKSDSRNKPGDLVNFVTHFTVPAVAEVWSGDARVEPGSVARPTRLAPGAPVYVRLGDAVIGLRWLVATTTTGEPAALEFIEDAAGGVARRLTLTHSATEPQGRATLAVWLRAAEGLDAAGFAAWRKMFSTTPAQAKISGDVVVAEVVGAAGALRIEADVLRSERRVLAGGEPAALLSVNGREVSPLR
jgi:hypothetical protein